MTVHLHLSRAARTVQNIEMTTHNFVTMRREGVNSQLAHNQARQANNFGDLHYGGDEE